MEMHEIKYFLAACRTLNFHRAAELSHVSQPALTRAVQKLEAELGGHLFPRERNQIRVTDFGRLMRSHLEQVLRQTDTAKVAAQSFLKLEAAPLTLGVMCTIGPLRFVGFLNDFREQHPAQVWCGVVSNVCCDASAASAAVFKPSAAPLPPPKPAIACTSCAA